MEPETETLQAVFDLVASRLLLECDTPCELLPFLLSLQLVMVMHDPMTWDLDLRQVAKDFKLSSQVVEDIANKRRKLTGGI